MITHQTSKRSLQDGTETEVHDVCRLTEFILIMPSHTAHERDRQIRAIIGLDVITQEINEVIDDDSPDTCIIEMIAYKLRERPGSGLPTADDRPV